MARDEHFADDESDHGPAAALPNVAPNGGDGRAWVISLSLHALMALLFWAIVWVSQATPDPELPPIRISPPDVSDVTRPKPPAVTTTDTVLVPETSIDPSPATVTQPSDEPLQTDNQVDTSESRGDPSQVSAVEVSNNTSLLIAIGVSGGGSGLFSDRGRGGHHRNPGHMGGSAGSEGAVQRSLRWFKRHQSANGMWDAEHYQGNCTEMPKCEPGSAASGGGSEVNVALTGYAVLCYLGAGYDHQTASQYRTTVRKGLEYLRSVQKADGLLGERNYEHAIATSALAEAYAMSNDPELKAPAQRAVNIILARQSKDAKGDANYGAGLGWDYRDGNPARNDASVSGWNVMALKSALAAGLDTGKGLNGAKRWLERAWQASNPDWKTMNDPYAASSNFAYTWDATSDRIDIGAPGGDAHDMAAIGGMCAVFLGRHAGDMMLESLANHAIMHQMPAAYPCNTYYLYYNTYTMFQVGGKRWDTWNGQVRDMLVKAQRQGEGCLDGSWDWEGTAFHGHDVGRVLSTAYCCLCLEVYYRDPRQAVEHKL